MNWKLIAIILIGMIAITAFSGCMTTGGGTPTPTPTPAGGEADSGKIPMPTDTGEEGAPPELPL
ncbi:MAG: hypothetical protein NT067_00760 [Candidatus Diapherotrites archaeon]|nr:hypothetical protein [Candidatus Diapherotrites archaeon]